MGLGPQIWHFLFGLGQRSVALEALALWGGPLLLSQLSQPLLPSLAACPHPQPLQLVQSAPSPLPKLRVLDPDRHRKFRLGNPHPQLLLPPY